MQITRRGIGGALILIVLLYVVFLSSHPTAIRHEGIVFTRPEPYYGGTNLYYYDLVTGRERKITHIYSSFGILPIRNPYGSSVRVESPHLLQDGHTIMFVADIILESRLYQLDRRTLGYQSVGDYPSDTINASTRLSPDGHYYVTRVDGASGSRSSSANAPRLDIFERTGTYVTTVYSKPNHTIRDSVWSPDSRQLLYTVLVNGVVQAYRYTLGGTSVELPLPSESVGGISWSPNQHRLAFTMKTSPTTSAVFTMDVDGGNLQQVTRQGEPPTNIPNWDGNAQWSPDETRLLFTRGGLEGSDLYIVNVDGTGLQRLTTATVESEPIWIPALP